MTVFVMMLAGITVVSFAMWPLPMWRYWVGCGGMLLIIFAGVVANA